MSLIGYFPRKQLCIDQSDSLLELRQYLIHVFATWMISASVAMIVRTGIQFTFKIEIWDHKSEFSDMFRNIATPRYSFETFEACTGEPRSHSCKLMRGACGSKPTTY